MHDKDEFPVHGKHGLLSHELLAWCGTACRPHDLDEAMHRRITMTFEFRRPDHTQRQQIWRRQLPEKIQRTDDVDINLLALKYELSGGYIRNAVQAALSRSVTL